jgi:glucan endo-1,3-alpha-glucosidase
MRTFSDGFALNVGIDSWQPARVADAFVAVLGTSFKLFFSFDMTSLSCTSALDATLLSTYINTYALHPNSLFYDGGQVVSTFSGEDCTFGQGSLNAAWTYAVKTGMINPIVFIPSFFSDVSTFASNTFQNGDFNVSSNSDIE